MINKTELPDKKYFKPSDIAKILNITTKTITNYCDKGLLKAVHLNSKHRLIPYESLIEFLDSRNMLYDDTFDNDKRKDVIYNRTDDTEILNKIKDYVITQNPNNLIIKENSDLKEVLNLVLNNEINRIFAFNENLLTEEGFEYVKFICDLKQTKIIFTDEQ